MKCGCSVDGSDAGGDCFIDSEDCLLRESVDVIKALLLASAWHGSKVNAEAEAFLKKLEG